MKSIAQTCSITCTNNHKTMQADVVAFNENKFLSVIVGTVKISLQYNGKLYVGHNAGLEFTSAGPKIINVQSNYSR